MVHFSRTSFQAKNFAAAAVLMSCFYVATVLKAQWLGADLTYAFSETGEVVVSMTLYYPSEAQNDIPLQQGVTFFEGKYGPPGTRLVLLLDTVITERIHLPLECDAVLKKTYLKASYRATTALPSLDGGYDLVWQGPVGRDDLFFNTDLQAFDGVSLVCHLIGKMSAGTPAPPYIPDPPVFYSCAGQKLEMPYNYFQGQYDSLVWQFSGISTTLSTAHPKPPSVPGQEQTVRYDFPESAPPFKTLDFREGYSPESPFGSGNHEYNKELMVLTFALPEAGDFLAGMTFTGWKKGMQAFGLQRVFRVLAK